MSLPVPQSIPPTCTLWVDGVRMADGATAGELPTDPVVLTDLKVVWGRDNTLDQPEPGTCTFEVLDQGEGVRFTDKLHIGSVIDVRTEATIYPDPTVPIFSFNPGFEGMTVGAVPPCLALGARVTVVSSPVHAGSRAVQIEATGARNPAMVIFPPAPFSADPAAWDTIPQAKAGQSWTYGASVRAAALLGGAQVVRVRPVAFTGTDGSAGSYKVLTDALDVASDATWHTVSGTDVPPAGVWLGVAVEVAAPGPRWDDVPGSVSWDSLGGLATRTNLALSPSALNLAMYSTLAATGTLSTVTGWAGFASAVRFTRSTTGAARLSTRVTWAAGVAVTVKAKVRASVAISSVQLTLRPDVTVNTGQVVGATVTIPAGTSEITFTATTPAAGANSGLALVFSPGAVADTLDITGVQVEAGTSLGVFFDGATPDAGGIDYAWTGTASASTSTATDTRPAVRWDDLGRVFVDDLVLNAPASGAVLGGIVFSGRLTDMSSQYDLAAGATVVRCIAQTYLAELDNRYVGDTPWLSETLAVRFARIVSSSGQSLAYKIDTSVQSVPVTWRDVDSQPAGTLLHQLAQSVGGALWSAFSDTQGVYLWLEDINNRPSLWVLVKDPDGYIRIHQNTDPSATATFMNLDSCDIDLEPVTWTQTTEDDATRVAITWQDQTVDTEGKPKPTSRDEITIDGPAESRTGRRRIQITTQLAQQTSAALVGQQVLARAQAPGWRIAGLEWNLAPTDRLDADQLQRLMRILDGVTRLGLGLLLTNVPAWAPPATGVDVPLFLEGGTFVNHDGAWELELLTSSAQAQGKSSLRWDDLPQVRNPTRSNPAYNPRAVAGGGGTWTSNRAFGTGGNGTYSDLTGISPAPVANVTTARRKTWTVAPTNNVTSGFNVRMNSTTHFPVTPGQTLTFSVYMRFAGTGTRTAQMILQFFTGTTVGGEGSVVAQPSAATVTLNPNVWTRLTMTYVVPAGANSCAMYPDIVSGGTLWAVGNTLDATAVLIEVADSAGAYFDGSVDDTADTDYGWSGTANNSASTARDIRGWTWDQFDPSVTWNSLQGVGI